MKMQLITIIALICGFIAWLMWNVAIWVSIDDLGHIWQIGANGLMFFFIFLILLEEEPTPHERITR